MYRQMEYIIIKDLGYNQEQVVVVPTQLGWNEKSNQLVERMQTRLIQEPFVSGVAGTSLAFSKGWTRYRYKINVENKVAYVYAVDPHYLDVRLVEA